MPIFTAENTTAWQKIANEVGPQRPDKGKTVRVTDRIYTCGHIGPEPRNMGRGVARKNRLAAWFARKCKNCALEACRDHVNGLTDCRGAVLWLADPSQAHKILEREVARIHLRYR